jgi:PAS domain S-box-containing protein
LKIRDKLRLAALLPIVLAMVIAWILIVTADKLNRVMDRGRTAQGLVQGVFELNILTYEFLEDRESRAREQWLQRHRSLGELLSKVEAPKPEDAEIVRGAMGRHREMGELFLQIAPEDESKQRAGSEAKPQELDRRLQRRLFASSHALMSLASRLVASTDAFRVATRQQGQILVLISVIALGAVLVVVLTLVARSVTRPIARLHEGTEIVGHGNLDYRLGDKTEDEIGELSQAFDQMTEKLRETTVSRNALAKEVAERKRAEEEIKVFFDVTLDMLCIANFEGYFVRLSPTWTKTLGWSEAELKAKPFIELVHPDDREATIGASAQLSEGQDVVGFDNRYLCKDGTYKWLSWNSCALAKRGLIIAAARDITERKRAEEEMKQSAEKLEAANKELEAFAYSVSHDLRAPLRHIDGFVNLLKRTAGPTLNETSTRYLQVITDSAKDMGRLIEDLLNFSRVSRAEMRKTAVALEPLVQEVIQKMQADARGRSVRWEIGTLPEVQGDAALLRVVMTNLISNALKYTRPRPQTVIELGTVRGKGDEVILFVRDNGVGFDMQYANKLFGVFQRLHRPEEFEGTGIGLATVRRIVHRHGGRTWAEGKVGVGATFYFSLPKH